MEGKKSTEDMTRHDTTIDLAHLKILPFDLEHVLQPSKTKDTSEMSIFFSFFPLNVRQRKVMRVFEYKRAWRKPVALNDDLNFCLC